MLDVESVNVDWRNLTPREVERQCVLLMTHEDLPYSDGIPLESHKHELQDYLLCDPLRRYWQDRDDVFVGANMFLYYSADQVLDRDYKGPDIMIVTGVRAGDRKSWVNWAEQKSPDVVIELLSASTAREDRTVKKQAYQDEARVPEYYWWDVYHGEEWEGFRLVDGVYQPIPVDARRARISQVLGLKLIPWEGEIEHVRSRWLRWATLEGELLPTSREAEAAVVRLVEQERGRAEQERERAEQERSRAEQERSRAERLAARLRELGIDPEA